jgi:hypothetical protein
LKTDFIVTELIDAFRCRSGFSLGLQNTWRCGKENFEEDGFTFLESGHDIQQGRESCGVGLIFSHVATVAWRAATPNNFYNYFGPRVIAARMLINDADLGGFFYRFFKFFAYDPTSDSQEVDITHFENALTSAISYCGPHDILIICMDANARIVCDVSDRTEDNIHIVIGPFGISHINRLGQRL